MNFARFISRNIFNTFFLSAVFALQLCGQSLAQSAQQPTDSAASPSPTSTPDAATGVGESSDASTSRTSSPLPTATPTPAQPVHSGRILGIIPNYRTVEEHSLQREPLTSPQKFKMAAQDSFDFSSFLVAGVFAGTSMAQAQYKEFGNGAEGFGKYYGAAFADQAIGNFMTEAILPSMLHQDPQYYTLGHGGFRKRTGYAIEREVVTFSDSGHNQFNASEVFGNAIAAGISNVYYPAQERNVSNTMQKWGQQIGTDAVFNVMKEFWPDVRKKVFGK